jgi:hypothetical protein
MSKVVTSFGLFVFFHKIKYSMWVCKKKRVYPSESDESGFGRKSSPSYAAPRPLLMMLYDTLHAPRLVRIVIDLRRVCAEPYSFVKSQTFSGNVLAFGQPNYFSYQIYKLLKNRPPHIQGHQSLLVSNFTITQKSPHPAKKRPPIDHQCSHDHDLRPPCNTCLPMAMFTSGDAAS